MLSFLVLIISAATSTNVLGQEITPAVTSCILSKSDQPINKPLLAIGTSKLYPVNGAKGNISVPTGTTFSASCSPGTSNKISAFNVDQVELVCLADGSLTANGVPTTYKDLGCVDPLREELVKTSPTTAATTCYKQNVNISIEFHSSLQHFPLITLCHDEKNFSTIMAKHTIFGANLKESEISNNRPSFKKAEFYTASVSPSTAYAQSSQRAIMQTLVNSAELADKYIDPVQSLYFARGHLAPDGDFIYVSEQNATYYFVNVIPQWQSINNGNWKALEMAVRNLAVNRSTTLNIYTGGFDVLKLKDVNNNLVDIYLTQDSVTKQLAIPAPKLTWKLVHDPKLKTAVVIVMVNNPHDAEIPPEDILCTSVCDQIKWVTWDLFNIKKGYTYCCTLSSFRLKVPYAPKLGTVKLLT